MICWEASDQHGTRKTPLLRVAFCALPLALPPASLHRLITDVCSLHSHFWPPLAHPRGSLYYRVCLSERLTRTTREGSESSPPMRDFSPASCDLTVQVRRTAHRKAITQEKRPPAPYRSLQPGRVVVRFLVQCAGWRSRVCSNPGSDLTLLCHSQSLSSPVRSISLAGKTIASRDPRSHCCGVNPTAGFRGSR